MENKQGRKEIEIFNGERVFTIVSSKSGKGYLCGRTYFPEELIGIKFIIKPLTKVQIKKIKEAKRDYDKYF